MTDKEYKKAAQLARKIIQVVNGNNTGDVLRALAVTQLFAVHQLELPREEQAKELFDLVEAEAWTLYHGYREMHKPN
jgi:Tfp pilus assembly PilM family ATPase